MNTELTSKLLKYLGQGALIYLLFKYVPKEPMSSRDTLLITVIVILAYAVFENMHALYYKEQDTPISPAQCNIKCAIKEENIESKESSEHMSGSVNNDSPIVPTQTQENKTTTDETQKQPTPENKSDVQNITSVIKTTVPNSQNEKNITITKIVEVPLDKSQSDLIKSRENEISNIDPTKIANTGTCIEPDILQKGIKRNSDGSFTIFPVKNPQAGSSDTRQNSDVITNEMPYNYTDYNTLPVSTTWDSWEKGSSFLPPAQWFPVPPHPPVCVTEKQCPVCPVFTQGTDISLKEWDQSRRISPPDNINISYIQDKLNSGR